MDKLVGEVMSYYQERVLLMEMLKAKDLQIAELEKEVKELKHELSFEDREVK